MLYIEIYAVLFFFSCLQSIASDRRTKGQKKIERTKVALS